MITKHHNHIMSNAVFVLHMCPHIFIPLNMSVTITSKRSSANPAFFLNNTTSSSSRLILFTCDIEEVSIIRRDHRENNRSSVKYGISYNPENSSASLSFIGHLFLIIIDIFST
jgi:hypothetical protein